MASDFSAVLGGGKGYTQVVGVDGKTYTVSGDRNWRNNNPGNLEYGAFTEKNGALGTDGRFAVFPDYQTGLMAQGALLFDSAGYEGMTIGQAIARYAPSFENDTEAYANSVANALGVSVDTPLSSLSPDQRNTMLGAMQKVEGFREGTIKDEFGNVVDPTSIIDPLSIPTPVAANIPTDRVSRFATESLPTDDGLAPLAPTNEDFSGLLAMANVPIPEPSPLSANLSQQAMQTDGIMSAVDPIGVSPVTQGPALSAPVHNAVPSGILAGYQAQGIAQPSADTSLLAQGLTAQRDYTAPAANPAAAYQQLADTAAQYGIMGLDGTKTMSLDGSLNASNPALANVAAPAIAGPATDAIAPAATQQAQTATRTAAQTAALNASPSMNAKPAGLLSKLGLSKESVVGGLLGNAALGPVGGLVGGLLGNYAANNPGSLGSFSNSPMTINNIGGGMANTSSVWGGDTPVGTQATASNGATITSMPGGFVAYTNKDGVTTVSSRNGDEGQAGYFGGFNFGGQSQADAAADTPGLY